MLTAYSNHARVSLGTGTVRQYVHKLGQLQRHYPDLLAVTTADLEQYLAIRRPTHRPETRKSMRTAFRSFYQWAYRTGQIPVDPSATLRPIRIPTSVPRVASDEVVQMGLLTADVPLKAMILLARFGCLRLTELTTLHTSQREHDLLRIIGKGEKMRLVPANNELLHVLLELEREQGPGYYFPGRFGGHMHPASVNKILTRHLGVNPHSLRHAGATAAYMRDPDLEALRIFLGHSSIATTQRYLHVGMTEVRRIAAATAFTRPIDRFPSTTLPRVDERYRVDTAA